VPTQEVVRAIKKTSGIPLQSAQTPAPHRCTQLQGRQNVAEHEFNGCVEARSLFFRDLEAEFTSARLEAVLRAREPLRATSRTRCQRPKFALLKVLEGSVVRTVSIQGAKRISGVGFARAWKKSRLLTGASTGR
jgi:hypothetical protein